MRDKKDIAQEGADETAASKNVLSVSSLLSSTAKLVDDNRKKLSQNLIGRANMKDIYFIPIGTKVSGVRRGGPNSEVVTIEDYYISSVTFSMFESRPLYGIQKMTNDNDLLDIYSHGSLSESVLVFKNKEKIQKSIFSPYRSRIVLSEDEDENKKLLKEKYKDTGYVYCSLVLADDEFILPGEMVWIALDTRNAQIVLSVVIDKDWTISYQLKDRDNFYVNSELAYKADILIRDMATMTCEITI